MYHRQPSPAVTDGTVPMQILRMSSRTLAPLAAGAVGGGVVLGGSTVPNLQTFGDGCCLGDNAIVVHVVRADDRGDVLRGGRQDATKQPLSVGAHDAADTRKTMRLAGNCASAHAMHCRATDVLHIVHISEAIRQIEQPWRMQPSDWVQNAMKYVPRKAVGHMQQQQWQAKRCLMSGRCKKAGREKLGQNSGCGCDRTRCKTPDIRRAC